MLEMEKVDHMVVITHHPDHNAYYFKACLEDRKAYKWIDGEDKIKCELQFNRLSHCYLDNHCPKIKVVFSDNFGIYDYFLNNRNSRLLFQPYMIVTEKQLTLFNVGYKLTTNTFGY